MIVFTPLFWIGFLLPICVVSGLGTNASSFYVHAVTKFLCSVCFVVIGWTEGLHAHALPWYFKPIEFGLCLGLIGDVFLLSDQVMHFQIGLVVFLMGHISYIVAFYNLCIEYSLVLVYPDSYLFPLLTVIFSAGIFAYLWPSLGKMKVEVFAYVIVISTMVILAYFASLLPSLQVKGKLLIFVGTILFYMSDIFVAFEKFVNSSRLNRFSLFLYYGGQVCLAYSIGTITDHQ